MKTGVIRAVALPVALGLVVAFLATVAFWQLLERDGGASALVIAGLVASYALGLALVAAVAGAPARAWLDGGGAGAPARLHPAPAEGTDPLTGLRGDAAFHADLARELLRRSRRGFDVTLVLLDVEGLRQVNGALGREAGDRQLVGLSRALLRTIRGADAAYRIGGDEFAVVLAHERAWGGFRFVQRLREDFARLSGDCRPLVTAGIAEARGTAVKDALVEHAGVALLEAKRSHRGVIVYTPGLLGEQSELERQADLRHRKALAAALARAVDAKDSYIRSHSETVAETCAMIAAELGLEPERIEKLRLAGLLHDVGKIGISDAILRKAARLTDDEYETMKTHSALGRYIVSAAELGDAADWIHHHHERLDGGGYPAGLHGEEIPLESRVILVADAFEAMTADRTYRAGRSQRDALDELERCAGSQFDADCVAALRRVLRERQESGAASALA